MGFGIKLFTSMVLQGVYPPCTLISWNDLQESLEYTGNQNGSLPG